MTLRASLPLVCALAVVACGPPPVDEEPPPPETARCALVQVRFQHPVPYLPYAVSVAVDGTAEWFSCGEDGALAPDERELPYGTVHSCDDEGFRLSLRKAGALSLTTLFEQQHWFTTEVAVESLPHAAPEGDAPCDEAGALEVVVDNLLLSDECVTEAAKAEPPCGYGIGQRTCGSDGVWYGERCNFHRDAPVGVCPVQFPVSYCGAH